MNEENARNTQFAGYAHALLLELAKDNALALNWDRFFGEMELTIARRAYDLVVHTIVELSCQDALDFSNPDFDKYEYADSKMVEVIPDMTELPKEQE